MLKVLNSLLQTKNRAALLQTAEEMNDAKNKDDYEKFLDTLQTLVHDIWTLKLGGDEDSSTPTSQTICKDLPLTPTAKNSPRWLTEIETMRERFAVNINKKIATDALFVHMAG